MQYEGGFPLFCKNVKAVKMLKMKRTKMFNYFRLKTLTFFYFDRNINMKKKQGKDIVYIRNNRFSRLFCWTHLEMSIFTLALLLF